MRSSLEQRVIDLEGLVSSLGSGIMPLVQKTANYTLTSTDYAVECTSGTFEVRLPTAEGITGKVYIVKNSGTGVITVNAFNTETIDGELTISLYESDSATLMSNGTNWIII